MRMRAVARPALPVAKRPSATSGADRAIVSPTLLTAADFVRAAQRPTRNGHRPATSCDAVAASEREPANHHSAHMYRVAVHQRHSSGTTVCALAALTQRTPWQWAERRCAAQSNTLETSASRSSQPPGPRLRGQPPKPPAKQRRPLLRAIDACTTHRARSPCCSAAKMPKQCPTGAGERGTGGADRGRRCGARASMSESGRLPSWYCCSRVISFAMYFWQNFATSLRARAARMRQAARPSPRGQAGAARALLDTQLCRTSQPACGLGRARTAGWRAASRCARRASRS